MSAFSSRHPWRALVLSDRDFPTHVAWGAWPRCSTLSSVTLKKGKEKDGRHALGDTSRVASLDQVCQTSFSFLPPTTTLRTSCGQLHELRPAPARVAAGAGDGSGSGGSRRACTLPLAGTHERRRCVGNGLIAGSQRFLASRTNRPSGGEVLVGASPSARRAQGAVAQDRLRERRGRARCSSRIRLFAVNPSHLGEIHGGAGYMATASSMIAE